MTNPSCNNCGSLQIVKKGKYEAYNTIHQRYLCKSCNKSFSELLIETVYLTEVEELTEVEDEIIVREEIIKGHESFFKDSKFVDTLKSQKRVIVTSVQNNTGIDYDFFNSLKQYANHLNAQLLIIPVRYRTISQVEEPVEYQSEVKEYLMENRVHFESHSLVIDGQIRIQATAENPLSGLEPLSKGKTLVIGHAQVQLKTMPRISEKYPSIITTTGSMSLKNYSSSKAGQKAEFNHSMSAVLIEFDSDCFHMRHLNYDEKDKSFCDLDLIVGSSGVKKTTASAIITGDEHVVFVDQDVKNATYGKGGIVELVKPDYIVRHDVLDTYSVSHHHQKQIFAQYAKQYSPIGCLRTELEETVDFINKTTPSYSQNVIVQSNHNEHLLKWLNESDPKKDMRNALIYHQLMYSMLLAMEDPEVHGTPDPFELFASSKLTVDCLFASRTKGFKVHGVECGSHGDVGTNGARGNRSSFSILPQKTVIGHSHSPGIEKGCYQVGTSQVLNLEYNKSASSWHHAHCIIHKNGKRQLVFITNGKFRME